MSETEARSGNKMSDYFSESDLLKIKEAVAEAEANTSGEIRVVIRSRYSEDLQGDIHAQAKHEFAKYGLGNTRDKTGVLILLVMSTREFRIIGDIGIYAKVGRDYWDLLAGWLTTHFKEGNYVLGICKVVDEVGKGLAAHFPKKSDDTNELSDDVIVEDEK